VFCVITEEDNPSNIYSSGCLSSEASFLCSDAYAQPGTDESLSNVCPAPDVARRQFFIVVAGSGSYEFFAVAIAANFTTYKNSVLNKGGLPSLQAAHVFIIKLGAGKRSDESGLALRQSGGTRIEYTVVSPNPTSYPQAALEADMESFVGEVSLLGGLTVTDKGSSEIDGGSTGSGSSGDDINLSDGEMAGIVIACIVGAAIIAAVAAYIVLRKKGGASYPAPFRSPAASFRP